MTESAPNDAVSPADAARDPDAAVRIAGACGRTVIRPATPRDGRLALIVEPADGKRLPCSRCRRDCPGRDEMLAVGATA